MIQKIYYFILAGLRSCIFALIFFTCYIFGKYVTSFGLHIYDYMFICVIITQIILIVMKFETREEVRVICIYHLLGLMMEIFKIHVWSWIYPDPGILTIMHVPLFSGFMYAAVGSFIYQAWSLTDLRFVGFPPFRHTVSIAILIYLNFFTHHFIPDIRYILLIIIAYVSRGCFVIFRIHDRQYRLHALLGLTGIACALWVAENIATFLGIWVYPTQSISWHLVSPHKIIAWFLLFIVSIVIVSFVKTKGAKDMHYFLDK